MACGKETNRKYPRPQEIIDLSYWNTSDEMVKTAHNNWAVTYEQDMETSKYLIPGALVSTLERVIQSRFPTEEKGAIMILDIGAGTGFVGEKCAAAGFTNLVAIDFSANMLAIAEEKNIYKHMVCDSLYNWRNHFIAGQFDVVLTAGVFTPGQMKPAALDEIICLVKPGGIMVHSVREDAYNTPEYGYESKFKELEEEGKIKLLSKERTMRYAHEEAAEYTVPYSFILVYQIGKHD